MNARFIKLWNDLKSSYYFIPGLMALGAIFLAFITGMIDRVYDYRIAEHFGWFYSNRPDGARAILTTIAGSMMTIASVTFSMTMVAVTTAAGQFGPRLIGNFMSDRGNQVTLGTFTGTFIYCLLILRLSRDGKTGNEEIMGHVPNVSLLVAVVLAIMSVAVMIYFVHHILETLNVGNITGRVGRKLRDSLKDVFPESVGQTPEANSHKDKDKLKADSSLTVYTQAEGFIQALNESHLMRVATENDLIVKVLARPGDFVTKGDELVGIFGNISNSDELERTVQESYAMGLERTEYQNVMFLADQLVEILARALSPGVNDPFTAINCLQWYKSALNSAMSGRSPSAYRYDDANNLRVIAEPISLNDLAERLCQRSLPYISGDVNVTQEMIRILKSLKSKAGCEDHAACIDQYLQSYMDVSKHKLPA